MKKLYTTLEYKKRQRRRVKKLEILRQKRKKAMSINKKKKSIYSTIWDHIKPPVIPPSDLRLIENLEGCLDFFRKLRSNEFLSQKRGTKFVIMSLKQVSKIDYGTISILTSLNDDFRFKKILLRTILPDNQECKKFMIESGYLNNLVDDNGRPFPKAEKSELIFFEKGTGYLSDEDSKKISLIVKNVVAHITGTAIYCQPVKTIILEICGNSIEWSGTENQQWLLGVKYETNKVIFTVTDVGRGILDTLYRKFSKKYLSDIFRKDDEILKRAFDKKYGSTSQEENRNKGLPAVKANYLQGKISGLKVLTNNVILHFDDDSKSREFTKRNLKFKGTFYQWEMTPTCFSSIILQQ
jgi:hypothetical protein